MARSSYKLTMLTRKFNKYRDQTGERDRLFKSAFSEWSKKSTVERSSELEKIIEYLALIHHVRHCLI